jgi:hypothetical protein
LKAELLGIPWLGLISLVTSAPFVERAGGNKLGGLVKQYKIEEVFFGKVAWLSRWHTQKNLNVDQLRKKAQEKWGFDVEPQSLRAYLEGEKSRTSTVRPQPPQLRKPRDSDAELRRAHAQLEELGEYDPTNKKDERTKVMQAIARRQGRESFRNQLLVAYGRKCAITKCDVVKVLEAAHISPYSGEKSNHVENGILLRADIHTLFDLGQIGIDHRGKKVLISSELKGTGYEYLDGAPVQFPENENHHPNRDVVEEHARESGLIID